MPSGQIVSPLPIGASRYTDAGSNAHLADPYTNMQSRGGGNPYYGSGVISQVNRGFDGAVASAPGDGAYQATQQTFPGRAARHAGGSMHLGPQMDFWRVRPVARFAWPIGRFYWEALLWWDKLATNVLQDSGMCISMDWSTNFFPRIYGAASGTEQGIQVGIRPGGILRFASRGAGGFEEVDLSAFTGSLLYPTKVRMQLRNATLNSDAGLDIIINDVLALTRTWTAGHRLPIPYTLSNATAAAGNNPGSVRMQMVSADIEPNQMLFVAQYKFVSGPDTPTL